MHAPMTHNISTYEHTHRSTTALRNVYRIQSTIRTNPSHMVVCCSVLQCVAVCCSVLQCVTVCCSAASTIRFTPSHHPACLAPFPSHPCHFRCPCPFFFEDLLRKMAFLPPMRVRACVCARACVCVCARVRACIFFLCCHLLVCVCVYMHMPACLYV